MEAGLTAKERPVQSSSEQGLIATSTACTGVTHPQDFSKTNATATSLDATSYVPQLMHDKVHKDGNSKTSHIHLHVHGLTTAC